MLRLGVGATEGRLRLGVARTVDCRLRDDILGGANRKLGVRVSLRGVKCAERTRQVESERSASSPDHMQCGS